MSFLFCRAIGDRRRGTVNTTWAYGTGRSSFLRPWIHRRRALAWHFGQCRLRHVMVTSPLRALWGVNRSGESRGGGRTASGPYALSTPH